MDGSMVWTRARVAIAALFTPLNPKLKLRARFALAISIQRFE
jgi:hypothetical protein